MNELEHLLSNRDLIAALEDDLAAAHRSLAEAVYKFAYNRGDDDLAERKRHLTDRIELLGIALASARHVENHVTNRRCAAAIEEHIAKTRGDAGVM